MVLSMEKKQVNYDLRFSLWLPSIIRHQPNNNLKKQRQLNENNITKKLRREIKRKKIEK